MAADFAELKDEINRLAAESLALRAILSHMLAQLAAIADPDIAAAVRRAGWRKPSGRCESGRRARRRR